MANRFVWEDGDIEIVTPKRGPRTTPTPDVRGAAWDESLHPRDDAGKFDDGGSMDAVTPNPREAERVLDKILGGPTASRAVRKRTNIDKLRSVTTRDLHRIKTAHDVLAKSKVGWDRRSHELAVQVIDRELKTRGARDLEYDESKHPRHPAGTPDGGKFAPSSGAGSAGDPNSDVIAQPSSAYVPSNPSGRDSRERFSQVDDTGRRVYTPERQALHRAIVAKYLQGKTSVDAPVATILGGGMASGKTTLVKQEGLGAENTVEVNVDKIRADLPEMREALEQAAITGKPTSIAEYHEEASDISRLMLQEASARKMNVLLDGTGDTTLQKLGGKVAEMRAQGHKIVAEYVTVPVEEAIARADYRARTTDRRFVPETSMRFVHAQVSRIFPEAVRQRLFDSARLWDTRGPMGSKPTLVASGERGKLVVHDEKLWADFLSKARDPTVEPTVMETALRNVVRERMRVAGMVEDERELDSEDVERMVVELVTGKPPSIDTPQANRLRDRLRREIDAIHARGDVVYIPQEIP